MIKVKLFIPQRNELFRVLPLGLPLARNLGFLVQGEFGEIGVIDNFIQLNFGFPPHQSTIHIVEGGRKGSELLASSQGGGVELGGLGGEGEGARKGSHQTAPAKAKSTKHSEKRGRERE